MVGFINTNVVTLDFVRSLLLKSHFNMGILLKKGTPLPVSDRSVLSIPPRTIMSSLCALMIDSNLLVDVGGGAFGGGVPIKSDISTLIFNVT